MDDQLRGMKGGILLLFWATACLSDQVPGRGPQRIPYDLDKPTRVFVLPEELVEISALTDVDSHTVACVQDERSTIYFLSMRDGTVKGSHAFAGAADMEGLTRVGDRFYALRSDGMMFRIDGPLESMVLADSFRLDLPNRNLEGLGYDEQKDRILVSPKDFLKGAPEVRDVRSIYAVSPGDTTHAVEEALRLSLRELTAQAGRMGIALPTRAKEDGREVPALKLRYSSVAMHPSLDHYYLLSAVDRTLLVVDRTGSLVDLVSLDASLLPKPRHPPLVVAGSPRAVPP